MPSPPWGQARLVFLSLALVPATGDILGTTATASPFEAPKINIPIALS